MNKYFAAVGWMT